MKKIFLVTLCGLLLIFYAGVAGSATNPPNLVGTWKGVVRGVVGASTFLPATATGAGSSITLTFTKQVDVRFSANAVLSPPLGNGKLEKISGVILGNEIHGVNDKEPIAFHGKLIFDPPGKPRIEGYFLKFKSAADNPSLTGVCTMEKTTP